MADDSDNGPTSDNDNGSSGDSLDFTSSRFDSLKALYAKDVKLPVPDAPAFDNLAIFTSRMKAGTLSLSAGKIASDRAKEKAAKEREAEVAAKNLERFKEHQRPVRTEKAMFQGSNIFTQLEKQSGPLARLKKCMDTCIKVKVVTRNEKGIRGSCTGFLQAFDKQWNVAMSDVHEVWTRKIKKKVPAGLEEYKISKEEVSRKRGPNLHVTVKPFRKGMESCERYIPQLLMRGEHVVMIVILT